jgi:hypothetical protein
MAEPNVDQQLAATYQPNTDLGEALRSDNPYLNAENRPNVPATQTQDATPPEIPLGWSERLANEANKIGVLPGVGGWAKSLVAASVSALPKRPQPSKAAQIGGAVQGIATSLGDAAAATEKLPEGAGGLTGALRTLQARGQRQQNEKRAAVLNDYTAAQTVALQRNAQHLDEEDQAKHEAAGQTWKQGLEKNHEKVSDGLTEQELMDGMKKGTLNTSDYQYQQTGHTLVPQNGKMVSIPTYTVFKKSEEPHELTSQEAAFLKANGQVGTDGKEIPAGAKLGGDQFDHAWTAAMASQTSRFQLEKTERDYNLNKLEVENKTQKAKDEAAVSGLMGQIQAQHPGMNAIDALGIISKNAAAGHSAEAQAASRLLGAYDSKELDSYGKQRFEERKQSEVERHNKAEETNKRAEIDQKKQQQITSNLTGDDYLKTLPTGQQATVRAVGEGRQVLPANRKEALALLEMVHQAYPDFDETKVKTWQKANNEYRGSGKTATQIVPAYNTSLEHMQDLYTNTTGEGVFNPLSKAYQDREIALGYVAREVGKAVSSGAMTQKESEDLLNTLKGGLTPALKRERITKTAQLLHDKIDEYQTKFNESAPSSAVKVPTLISPKAAQSYDFVTGKTQEQPKLPTAPQGQIAVQVPGMPVGFIPQAALAQFRKDHPDAQVGQ